MLEVSGRVLPWRVGDRRSCPCGLKAYHFKGYVLLFICPLEVLTTTTDMHNMHNIHANPQFAHVATLHITRPLQSCMISRIALSTKVLPVYKSPRGAKGISPRGGRQAIRCCGIQIYWSTCNVEISLHAVANCQLTFREVIAYSVINTSARLPLRRLRNLPIFSHVWGGKSAWIFRLRAEPPTSLGLVATRGLIIDSGMPCVNSSGTFTDSITLLVAFTFCAILP